MNSIQALPLSEQRHDRERFVVLITTRLLKLEDLLMVTRYYRRNILSDKASLYSMRSYRISARSKRLGTYPIWLDEVTSGTSIRSIILVRPNICLHYKSM